MVGSLNGDKLINRAKMLDLVKKQIDSVRIQYVSWGVNFFLGFIPYPARKKRDGVLEYERADMETIYRFLSEMPKYTKKYHDGEIDMETCLDMVCRDLYRFFMDDPMNKWLKKEHIRNQRVGDIWKIVDYLMKDLQSQVDGVDEIVKKKG